MTLRPMRQMMGETGRLPEGTTLPVALASTSFVALIDLAELGCGIASLPYFAITKQLREGRLQEVLSDDEKQTRAFGLLWPRSKYPLPKYPLS
ncbi:MAG: LysR substrate-binding domain-containing protein [Novosphingobium sp.]